MPSLRALLLAGTLFSLGACSTVLDYVQDASDSLDRLAEENNIVPPSEKNPEIIYQEGVGQHQQGDDEAAAASFRRAAKAGHGPSAYALALAYREGRGVPRNLAASGRWMAEAADLGEARAQYALGEAFANGRGVAPDKAWAARWYGKAAHQGHRAAQFAYGRILASGDGLPKDPRAGYAWLTLAAESGHALAKEARRSLAGTLGAAERAAAEAWAAQFTAAPSDTFADPPTVRYVQHRLNGLGYKTGRVDGVVGPRTRTGIGAFQQAHGLTRDGRVTPDLLISLFKEPLG